MGKLAELIDMLLHKKSSVKSSFNTMLDEIAGGNMASYTALVKKLRNPKKLDLSQEDIDKMLDKVTDFYSGLSANPNKWDSFINMNKSISKIMKYENSDGMNIAMIAATKGYIEVVSSLVKLYPACAVQEDVYGKNIIQHHIDYMLANIRSVGKIEISENDKPNSDNAPINNPYYNFLQYYMENFPYVFIKQITTPYLNNRSLYQDIESTNIKKLNSVKRFIKEQLEKNSTIKDMLDKYLSAKENE